MGEISLIKCGYQWRKHHEYLNKNCWFSVTTTIFMICTWARFESHPSDHTNQRGLFLQRFAFIFRFSLSPQRPEPGEKKIKTAQDTVHTSDLCVWTRFSRFRCCTREQNDLNRGRKNEFQFFSCFSFWPAITRCAAQRTFLMTPLNANETFNENRRMEVEKKSSAEFFTNSSTDDDRGCVWPLWRKTIESHFFVSIFRLVCPSPSLAINRFV